MLMRWVIGILVVVVLPWFGLLWLNPLLLLAVWLMVTTAWGITAGLAQPIGAAVAAFVLGAVVPLPIMGWLQMPMERAGIIGGDWLSYAEVAVVLFILGAAFGALWPRGGWRHGFWLGLPMYLLGGPFNFGDARPGQPMWQALLERAACSLALLGAACLGSRLGAWFRGRTGHPAGAA